MDKKNVTKHTTSEPMCSKVMLVSRLSIAGIFAMSAFGKITGFAGQAGFAASSWVPLPGELLIAVAILMEVFGTVALVSGWKFKQGALVLVAYTAMATAMFHIGEGQAMNLLKNLAIIGGLLAVSMLAPGKYAVSQK